MVQFFGSPCIIGPTGSDWPVTDWSAYANATRPATVFQCCLHNIYISVNQTQHYEPEIKCITTSHTSRNVLSDCRSFAICLSPTRTATIVPVRRPCLIRLGHKALFSRCRKVCSAQYCMTALIITVHADLLVSGTHRSITYSLES